MITIARVQRKPLNVITDNVVIQLMWLFYLRLTKSQVVLCIVILCLMLSPYLGPIVITLSCFHCIWKFHFALWWYRYNLENLSIPYNTNSFPFAFLQFRWNPNIQLVNYQKVSLWNYSSQHYDSQWGSRCGFLQLRWGEVRWD